MTDLPFSFDVPLKINGRLDAAAIERSHENSRARVLRALRNAQGSGRWCSWKFLQDTCGTRYGRAIHELIKAGHVIEHRASQTQGTGNDYLLHSEPSPQTSLPLPTPRKLTKSARREREAVLRWMRALRDPGGSWYGQEFSRAIERGEHLR